jgi:UDP-N-acetylglucosamine 3-dehydrogenase
LAKEIGAGVIGLRMGRAHLAGYQNNPHTEILGICDTDEEILARMKKEFNVPLAVKDYRKLLEEKEIRMVSIATPDFVHTRQALDAMEAGKDILCEKPMTASVEEAKEIITAVRRTGRRFMVGQVCRYAPGFILAKKMVVDGKVGELFLVESEYAHSYAKSPGVGNWRKDPRREPFLGGGCHAVDLLRWIAGDAKEVFAYSNHKCLTDWPVDDCTVALYKFPENVIGKVMVSIGCIRPYTMRTVLYGTKGTIICDNTSPQIYLCKQGNFRNMPAFASYPVEIESHNVSDEIAEFVDCILNDKPVLTNEIEGAKTVATCLAAVESAKTGRPVKIEKVI